MHRIRDITTSDHAAILNLNNAAVPAVSELSNERLNALLSLCEHRIAIDTPVSAFALTIAPDQPYWSANYAWVTRHFSNFLYLDRIVVDASHRGAGLGRGLYAHVMAHTDADHLVLEVNTRPANEISLAFHAELGFEEVGRAEPYGDGLEVAYLAKQLK